MKEKQTWHREILGKGKTTKAKSLSKKRVKQVKTCSHGLGLSARGG